MPEGRSVCEPPGRQYFPTAAGADQDNVGCTLPSQTTSTSLASPKGVRAWRCSPLPLWGLHSHGATSSPNTRARGCREASQAVGSEGTSRGLRNEHRTCSAVWPEPQSGLSESWAVTPPVGNLGPWPDSGGAPILSSPSLSTGTAKACGRGRGQHLAAPGRGCGVAWCHPLRGPHCGHQGVPPLAPASPLLATTSVSSKLLRPLRTSFRPLHLHPQVPGGLGHDGRQAIKEAGFPGRGRRQPASPTLGIQLMKHQRGPPVQTRGSNHTHRAGPPTSLP